ncbi:discoidin domain-containing protein [Paenibacillus pectinilyticus]|uniref:discoidin domain-containing protein n=1 Tax=Paenibacillus pectinilyticus TaxID=512399 RepID=UPI001FC9E178|nr:discoidin domain-containing protein [Paenibacillus pectinilyticus]
MKSVVYWCLGLTFVILFLVHPNNVEAANTTYYVDASGGSDTNAGTSSATAWKTLAKVNGVTFQQGDRLLFKAGGVWNGQLYPKGSGVSGSPIQIDQYGTGSMPIINGGGNTQGAVYLYNQQYWEIRNLEVTNTGASRNQYVGIKALNDTGGAMNHIYVGNTVVHDVNGVTSGFYGTNGGITILAKMDNDSTWNDVVIENNSIYTVDRIGIMVGPAWQTAAGPNDWITHAKSANITIQNNTIRDSGGDGILNFQTSNALIQNNVVSDSGGRASDGSTNTTGYSNQYSAGIWSAIADNTTIQYNEVYGEKTTLDGEGFDIDLGTNHTTVQFNYSHHNLGGFMLYCESSSNADINDAKVRYNISHDDKRGIFVFCAPGLSPGTDKMDINNNTFYIPQGTSTPMFTYSGGTLSGTMYVYNNIFYVLGTTSYSGFSGTTFDYNTFYGTHPASEPADAHKLTSDPLLAAPGSAAIGRSSVDGYKLRSGSPALSSGTYTNASAMGTADYWGNAVTSGAVNRGAYNGAGIAGVLTNYAFNAAVTTSSSYESGSWGRIRLFDGQRESVIGTSGYSSSLGVTTNHTEWIQFDMGTAKTFSSVTLYPRSTAGYEGEGFPVNFQIQVWNGSTWLTRVTQTAYPNPGSTPQTFTWGFSDTTDQIRVYATSLDKLGSDYVLQLAEIEVNP